MTKRVKRRRWPWILGGVGGVLLVGGWVVAFHSRFDIIPAAQSLPDSVGQYRSAGFYWTMADFPHSAMSEEQNAAGLLQLAGKSVKSPETSVNSQADVPKAKEELEGDATALRLAEIASGKPYLSYGRDWDQGLLIMFNELSPEKAIVKALCLRARCEAYDDGTAMRADLATALRLVRLYAQDSTLIGYLVQIACEAIVLKAVEFCASVEHEKPSELSSLKQTVEQYPFKAELQEALRTEAYLEITTLRNRTLQQIWKDLNPDPVEDKLGSDPEPAEPPKAPIKRSGYPDSIVCRAFMARVLQTWTRVAPAFKTLQNDPEKLSGALDAEVRSTERNQRFSDTFISVVFPVFSQAGSAELKARATEKCTLALIAALEYRAKTGRYPASIEQLPGKWVDPFDGKLLRLKRTDNGIRIYSIGPDRIDTGGVAQTESDGKPCNVLAAFPPVTAKSAPFTGSKGSE